MFKVIFLVIAFCFVICFAGEITFSIYVLFRRLLTKLLSLETFIGFIIFVLACTVLVGKDRFNSEPPDESVLEQIRADECKRFPNGQGMREYCKGLFDVVR